MNTFSVSWNWSEFYIMSLKEVEIISLFEMIDAGFSSSFKTSA